MSIKYVDKALDYPDFTGVTRLVLIALANYADEYGQCYPSQKAIAKSANASDRQIRRALAELVAGGAVSVLQEGDGRGHRTVYQLHINGVAKVDNMSTFVGVPIKVDISDKGGHPVQKKVDILSNKGGHLRPLKVDISVAPYKEEPSLEPSYTRQAESGVCEGENAGAVKTGGAVAVGGVPVAAGVDAGKPVDENADWLAAERDPARYTLGWWPNWGTRITPQIAEAWRDRLKSWSGQTIRRAVLWHYSEASAEFRPDLAKIAAECVRYARKPDRNTRGPLGRVGMGSGETSGPVSIGAALGGIAGKIGLVGVGQSKPAADVTLPGEGEIAGWIDGRPVGMAEWVAYLKRATAEGKSLDEIKAETSKSHPVHPVHPCKNSSMSVGGGK